MAAGEKWWWGFNLEKAEGKEEEWQSVQCGRSATLVAVSPIVMMARTAGTGEGGAGPMESWPLPPMHRKADEEEEGQPTGR